MPPVEEPAKKKTRRRLRVSCVECTRRRQKCDRAQPCGLCKRRGVEHLCRWELEPFARPPPTRPHGNRKSENKSSANRAQNQARENIQRDETATPSTASTGLEATLHLEHEVKEAAIALAQLSVARHGEYLGTGSLVCALHRLNGHSEAKIPIDRSSSVPSSSRSPYTSTISTTFLSALQMLVSNFPDRPRSNSLVVGFFEKDNWRFGLPQTLILSVYHSMWDTIATDERALERINFNWVAFLFSIFALSSGCSSEQESRKYFLQALTAKRLAEDVRYASFFTPRDSGSFSQGTAHGCIAVALMAEYMCDRGQLTEAWNLVGSAVRSALNAGLHLNPAWRKWKDMTKDEQTFRKLAWHMCAFKDRFLSLALGRPGMVRSCDFFVPVQQGCPPLLAVDGSSDTTYFYQTCLIRLMEIVGEEKNKFLCVHLPDTNGVDNNFDSKMSSWKASLPTYFALRDSNTNFDNAYPKLPLQRCLLACYYYFCQMLFQRSLPCLKRSGEDFDEPIFKIGWDFDRLTRVAISLLGAERSFLQMLEPQHQVFFTSTYFIFEAVVTLCIAMCRNPGNPKVDEWRKERDSAINLLQSILSMDNSELTQHAIVVLRILQDRRPSSEDSVGTPPMGENNILTLPTPAPSDASAHDGPPETAAISTLFPLGVFDSDGPSGGIDQGRLDLNSAISFSGFDFLFNTAIFQ